MSLSKYRESVHNELISAKSKEEVDEIVDNAQDTLLSLNISEEAIRTFWRTLANELRILIKEYNYGPVHDHVAYAQSLINQFLSEK